ncbi:low-density lipoprotein receptor-related protein 11 [Perognathus longimembris pacificus]|uniref:low-density lipoprotein receptor-related protein 11 n=1 Tax=Perognathus longimembris pacificus TaxID=214514 RepID=UPI00201874B9|nr:low-density lipoprotein receptor-related protein 11 [Perognathus longimembris pacificus]
MVRAAGEGAGSGRRRPWRPGALRGLLPPLLLLLCPWPPSVRAAGAPPAPLSELHAQLSGVEQLLEEFRRQLQQERPQEELELELRGGGGPREGCPGPGGDGYSAMADAIIRTKDSIAAGASFLRAPAAVRDWRQCVASCCSEPRCSVAVVERPRRPPAPAAALRCYLFNCTAHGRSVCKFALHRGYSSYSLSRAPDPGDLEAHLSLSRAPDLGDLEAAAPAKATAWAQPPLDEDTPPLSKAGKDVILHLPTDGVILDGRESTDDHAIVKYEWTLLQGDPSLDMKVPQPGTLKLSHLQEGDYTFQLTVTDTVGQRSSDNVSVAVRARTYSPGGCLTACSRYHFFCDDGCCIDITLACDGVRQCPDGSDETFCQNLGLDRKMVTHTAAGPAQPGTMGRSQNAGENSVLEKSQKAPTPNQPAILSDTEKNHSSSVGSESEVLPLVPDISSKKQKQEENFIFESKSDHGREHPPPEAGAVLPLALGLAITASLLLMVACRLRLMKQKLKKARPITSEESDYLINGMYL